MHLSGCLQSGSLESGGVHARPWRAANGLRSPATLEPTLWEPSGDYTGGHGKLPTGGGRWTRYSLFEQKSYRGSFNVNVVGGNMLNRIFKKTIVQLSHKSQRKITLRSDAPLDPLHPSNSVPSGLLCVSDPSHDLDRDATR